MPKRLGRAGDRWIAWGVAAAFTLLALGIVFGSGMLEREVGRPNFARGTLTMTTHDGVRLTYKAEIALTPAEQAYGLMFRKKLPPDAAMIFVEEEERVANFWMKNTLIPLDMLFVWRDGTIAKIAANAQPLSLQAISSDEPVAAVVEIAGGSAAAQGIQVGDKIDFPVLGQKSH